MFSRKSCFFLAAAAASLLSLTSLAPAATPDKARSADVKDSAKKDGAKSDKKVKDAKKDDAKKDDAKKSKRAKKDDAKKDDAKKDEGDVTGTASIGAPNKGRLQGALKLHSSRSLKVREKANAWGLPALVKLLQRAAGKVAKHHPKSVLLVGDLSQKTGGALTGHNSHQTGRDADVGFYIQNSHGKNAVMKRFVAFDGSGKSAQVSWAQFDDARNWALVEALLTDSDTAVRYIFVSNPLRARVLAFAAKKKVSKELYSRAESVLMSPHDADVHDDHFHVRITCPESMKGTCVEESIGHAPPTNAAVSSATKPAEAKPATADDAAKPASSDDAAKPASTDVKSAADEAPKTASN